MNKIDTEYGSLADVPQSVAQYYSEESGKVALNKPDEVPYSQVSQRIGERKSRSVVDAELARAIEWEEFYYGHDLVLEHGAAYAEWLKEQPTEIIDGEEVIVPAPEPEVIDISIRREYYQVTTEGFDTGAETLVQYDRTYNDSAYLAVDAPVTEPRDPALIAADNMEAAKSVRDEALSANIEVFGVMWQVGTKDRDNINEAINKGVRNQLSGSETRWWILADNSIRETTLEELGQIMDAYTSRMDDIYLQYGTWRSGDKLTPFTY